MALIAGPEETLWEGRPSLKALLTRIVAALAVAVLLPIGGYAAFPRLLSIVAGLSADLRAAVAEHRADIGVAAALLVASLVLVRLVRLGWEAAVLKSQRYRITNQRLVIETGVFSRRIEEIDMRTVEDLAFHQSFLERLLGIGTITVVAADRTAGRYPLLGIERPRELRELLRNSAYQATRGQLFTRQT